MNVVFYSYFTPLAVQSSGGAQASVDRLLRMLVRRGVNVTVLCPPEPTDRALLDIGDGLRLIDRLRGIEAPGRGRVGPDDFHLDRLLIEEVCADADVVVSLDRRFPASVTCPVVLSINSFVYPPESEAVFSLDWDALVTPSDYTTRCVSWYLDAGAPGTDARPIVSIPYGVDVPDPGDDQAQRRLRAELGIKPDGLFLAFPHRLDQDKGFETAIEALILLRQRGIEVTLLVPTPDDEEIWTHQRPYLDERQRLAGLVGYSGAVVFHRWIGRKEMPSYLRCCQWTLNLSRLPEAFGLTAHESLAAGVPVISTPAGALSELIPADHGVRFIDFEDAEMVAAAVQDDPPSTAEIQRGIDFLTTHRSWAANVDSWLTLLGRVNRGAPPMRVRGSGRASPWLRPLPSGRVWDDYRRTYVSAPLPGEAT